MHKIINKCITGEFQMHIYKLINKINNKFYIGKTVKSLKQRFNGHKAHANRGSKYHVHRAMRKYGYDNFQIELIESVEDEQTLNEREIYWISELNPHYNTHSGGQGGSLKGRPDITGEKREKWLQHWRQLGKTPWNKGKTGLGGYKHSKPKSQEHREVLSEIQKNLKETCPHCGLITNPGNISKYHGDKCVLKSKDVDIPLQKNNTSGYRGVIWNKSKQKWNAKIQMNKKIYRLGSFVNKEDAIHAIETFKKSLLDNTKQP